MRRYCAEALQCHAPHDGKASIIWSKETGIDRNPLTRWKWNDSMTSGNATYLPKRFAD